MGSSNARWWKIALKYFVAVQGASILVDQWKLDRVGEPSARGGTGRFEGEMRRRWDQRMVGSSQGGAGFGWHMLNPNSLLDLICLGGSMQAFASYVAAAGLS